MNHFKRHARFIKSVYVRMPFTKMVFLLVVLWLIFSAGVYFAERDLEGASINSYGEVLYWGGAAFSAAGIADAPVSATAQLIRGGHG